MDFRGGLSRVLYVGFTGFMGVGFIVLCIITLIPDEASKLNGLGYYSVCSFVPISTGILLVLSAAFLLLAWRKFHGLLIHQWF